MVNTHRRFLLIIRSFISCFTHSKMNALRVLAVLTTVCAVQVRIWSRLRYSQSFRLGFPAFGVSGPRSVPVSAGKREGEIRKTKTNKLKKRSTWKRREKCASFSCRWRVPFDCFFFAAQAVFDDFSCLNPFFQKLPCLEYFKSSPFLNPFLPVSYPVPSLENIPTLANPFPCLKNLPPIPLFPGFPFLPGCPVDLSSAPAASVQPPVASDPVLPPVASEAAAAPVGGDGSYWDGSSQKDAVPPPSVLSPVLAGRRQTSKIERSRVEHVQTVFNHVLSIGFVVYRLV